MADYLRVPGEANNRWSLELAWSAHCFPSQDMFAFRLARWKDGALSAYESWLHDDTRSTLATAIREGRKAHAHAHGLV